MKLKTKFCERFFNLSPRIVIYDLDGTIIDSSHRIKLHDNGSLNLDHWKQNCTKEQIFKDSLLPLYWQLVADYKQGNYIVICTARELNKYDLEFIHSMGIYYDKIISRPAKCTTVDHVLKKQQLRYFWNLRPFKNVAKSFYDDNENNLKAIDSLGVGTVFNADLWNSHYQ
tara:strand:+ start:128 stop:637 length:510 start_codon:yes stop_codon:yes gene_type:complete